MQSVEEALTTLDTLGVWTDSDVGMMTALAEKVGMGVVLTDRQRRAAYRTLRRYDGHIDFAAVTPPNGTPAAPASHIVATRDSVRVSCEGGRIVVRTPFKFKDVCKGIANARWAPGIKAWTYPPTPTAAANIRAAFLRTHVLADERFVQLCAQHDTDRLSQIHRDAEDAPAIPVTRTEPWAHQRRAFWFAKDLPATGLWLDMGVGKTKIAVDLTINNEAQRTLILCPWSVVPVWGREYETHGGVPVHFIGLQEGSVAQRTQLADEALHDCTCQRPHAIAINYEASWRKPFSDWALHQDWDYLVLDEVHRIKAAQGTISKFCYRLSQRATKRLGLSGTPLPQSPLDAFGIYRALDPDIFGLSYTAFSHRFAIFGGYGNYEVVDYTNMEEFDQRFFSIAFRVTADDVLDLPPDHDVRRTCSLSPAATKIYRSVESDLYAELEAGEITAANVLVKLLRLQQICGGSVNDDDGNAVAVDDAKEKLLEDVLTDLRHDEPVVVFCRFVHDLDVVERVTKRLSRRYGELSGRRRDGTDAHARMNPDVDIVAVQIQSGGEGIDLTRAHYGIYYSLGYSLKDFLQSRRRLVRPGQEHPVLFTHLVCANTVDEDVYEALDAREKVVEFVLQRRLGAVAV